MALHFFLLALSAQPAFAITPADVLSQSYDYLIVGGGLAGLTLANRLTEDSDKQVLVLEAGEAHLNDPLVDIPGFIGATLGNTSYDWVFTTVPQAHANNKSFVWSRGKMLGGSTGISFLAFTRPVENEIDAIGGLGNPGWTGEELFKYMRKAETFTPPDPANAAANNLTFIPSAHGTTGPLHDSFSRFICDAQEPWLTALETLGVHRIEDPLAGEDVGVFLAPSTIDGVSITRSYAATAYYVPVSNRSNLVVLTGAEATRIISFKTDETVEATAVEFLLDGETHNVSVNSGGEVIVSTGTIKTPQLLELSGIGDPQILNTLGVDVNVNLPGVGEGMIDQFFFGVSFELKNDSIITLDDLRDSAFLAGALEEYEANKTGIMTLGVTAFALVPLHTIVGEARAESLIDAQAHKIAAGNFSHAQQEKWDVIIQGLREPTKRGYIELAAFTGFFTTASTPGEGKKYMTLTGHLRFPFSTGSIHATSADPTAQPLIDPHYFEQDIGSDLEVMVDVLKYIRKLGGTGGFRDLFASETDPGASVQANEEIMQYIKNHGGTEYHTVGTAAMLPREKGGVVSPELKVYGTSNIRGVDVGLFVILRSLFNLCTILDPADTNKWASHGRALRNVSHMSCCGDYLLTLNFISVRRRQRTSSEGSSQCDSVLINLYYNFE
ncbi:GMC oxidoreductase [Mycena sanguinolenta]|nr:GMC oxidoreductase [Mycena sanguinolenta]